MITLNGKMFAKNDKEFTNTLFTKGGTASGFYKAYKTKINLYDMQHKLVGVISNNVLAKATKQKDGKHWYSYGNPDIIGEYDSYRQYTNEVHAISNEFNLTIKH